MAIKLVFLDLNGTIVNDWGQVHASVCAVFLAYGLPCPSLHDFIEHVAHTGDYLEFYHDHGLQHASRDELYDVYLPHYCSLVDTIVTTHGAIPVLQDLADFDLEVHLMTAARKDMADMLIEHCNIREYCDGYHYHVHNKEMQIRAIIDGMDISPDECVMMGDLPSDVRHAKRAGIRGVAIRNTHVPVDVFSGLEEMDFLAKDFYAFLEYVKGTFF